MTEFCVLAVVPPISAYVTRRLCSVANTRPPIIGHHGVEKGSNPSPAQVGQSIRNGEAKVKNNNRENPKPHRHGAVLMKSSGRENMFFSYNLTSYGTTIIFFLVMCAYK